MYSKCLYLVDPVFQVTHRFFPILMQSSWGGVTALPIRNTIQGESVGPTILYLVIILHSSIRDVFLWLLMKAKSGQKLLFGSLRCFVQVLFHSGTVPCIIKNVSCHTRETKLTFFIFPIFLYNFDWLYLYNFLSWMFYSTVKFQGQILISSLHTWHNFLEHA